ncbi:MAG: GDP-L-fucose synthase [Alphaproteobacteria bacterium]|nr:GDP-L-fucose synthase [Alphaproteobacteria bacterium]
MNKFDIEGKRIFVAGHKGMAGSSIVRRLAQERCEILTVDRATVDLRRQDAVERWFEQNRPDVVFLAAAKVGGIWANSSYPAEFIYDNLVIESNIIHASYLTGVKKLVFLGSSCIYPRMAPQPMKEDALLSGPLEPTNEWYAIAKIAGIKLCQAYRRQYGCDFISAMPTNLYGQGDNYDPKNGHVVAALILKAHAAKLSNAKTMELWGTGKPLREFLFVDDLADGLVFLLKNYSDEPHVNLGSGVEHTIRQLAEAVAKVVGFKGDFVFDATKPDGTPRKLMDNGVIQALGWHAHTSLEDGLRIAYDWFLKNGAAPTLALRKVSDRHQ